MKKLFVLTLLFAVFAAFSNAFTDVDRLDVDVGIELSENAVQMDFSYLVGDVTKEIGVNPIDAGYHAMPLKYPITEETLLINNHLNQVNSCYEIAQLNTNQYIGIAELNKTIVEGLFRLDIGESIV